MVISIKVKKNILKKINETLNSKEEKKFLLLIISEEEKGIATGFLSNYNNMETLGHMEKSKLFVHDKIKLEELNNEIVNNNDEEEKKTLSYVS